MKNIKFNHIRIYTENSINLGLIKIDDIIKLIIKNKKKSVVISDLNSLAGSIDFYNKCIKNKLKPILGCEIIVNNKLLNYFKILFLIKNKLGYINLSKLLSRASIYNKDKDFFKIEAYWLKSSLRKGLILITGGKNSDIGFFIKKNKEKLINIYIYKWKKLFKFNIFLEIQRNLKNNNKLFNNKILKISLNFKIPLIATHDIFFLKKRDFLNHEIKICIQNNKPLNFKNLMFKKYNYFYDDDLMIKLFKDIPVALINTNKLCDKCNLNLDLNKIKLPFYIENKFNNNKYILKLLKISLLKKNIKINKKIYFKRLFKECEIIIKIGVVDYFLIVRDLIKWSKKKNIIKGPGRGSCSASLVSYLLNITIIDPIKYGLIFERFLNIERFSIPDFDIDFCSNKRDIILKYIKYKYGLNKIFQILTFNKITIKNSIRDVGRILNFNYNFINRITKSLNFSKKNIKEIIKENLEIKNLIKSCIKLENLKKNIGVHAGGLILYFNNFFFSYSLYNNNEVLISNQDKDNLEILGIIKIDFLALKTLTIIKNIKNSNNYLLLNLDNKLNYYFIKKTDTNGIFQLESFGIKNTIKKSKPIKFENIISLISIYRPGPINLIKNFYLRKLNLEKIKYIDFKVKKLLKETYGFVIYQEQVIFITKIISNFSLSKSDILRIAMSKKKLLQMSKERELFCFNSKQNNIKEKKSNLIFNLLEKFSGYGFNKSHAVAYSFLSCYMMYLKIYYNLEFFVANMSYFVDDTIKLNFLIKEAKKKNIIFLPLNINESNYNFKLYNRKISKIRFGFKLLKGLGDNIIMEIINLRKSKKFKNLTDFYKRVSSNVNYRVIELLISSGAFDGIDYNKAFLIKNLIDILKDYNFKNKINFQKPLFLLHCNSFNFWDYTTEINEENTNLGFNIFYNLYNIFLNKFEYILDYNDNFFLGEIKFIHKKNLYNSIFLNTINNEYNFNVKINEIFFKKKFKIFKIQKILIFKINIIKNDYYYVKQAFDIKNFLFSYKSWLELELIL